MIFIQTYRRSNIKHSWRSSLTFDSIRTLVRGSAEVICTGLAIEVLVVSASLAHVSHQLYYSHILIQLSLLARLEWRIAFSNVITCFASVASANVQSRLDHTFVTRFSMAVYTSRPQVSSTWWRFKLSYLTILVFINVQRHFPAGLLSFIIACFLKTKPLSTFASRFMSGRQYNHSDIDRNLRPSTNWVVRTAILRHAISTRMK